MKDQNMEDRDKDFESFLRQFHLRQPRAFPEGTPVSKSSAKRWWTFAAAASIVVALLAIPLLRNSPRGGVSSASVEVAGDSSYMAGERITDGSPIRAGRSESVVLHLEDGTQLEMRAQSEAVLRAAEDGIHIRLNEGTVLVSAARQRASHLFVETQDAVVSVTGTVFLVEAQASATRVGVIEGSVEVQQGAIIRKVSQGEQLSTSTSPEEQALAEMIAWSRRASEWTALLPPPPPIVVAKAPPAPVPQAVRKEVEQEKTPQPQAQDPRQPARPNPPEQPKSDPGENSSGQQIYYRVCFACHNIDMNTQPRGTRDQYASRVALETSRGAQLSNAEASALVDYLFKTYGLQP